MAVVCFAVVRTSPLARIMHVVSFCSVAVLLMVESPSNTFIYRCKLRDGVNDQFFFVIFFRVGVFCRILADETGKFDFFSGSVF